MTYVAHFVFNFLFSVGIINMKSERSYNVLVKQLSYVYVLCAYAIVCNVMCILKPFRNI